MRKDKQVTKNISLAAVQGYHQGGYTGNYAYQGFANRKYFTSDRYINLDANFRRPDGKPLKGYGLEIEAECNGITKQDVLAEVLDKIVFAQFPADLFKMQRDGSLGGRSSAECITQVMTREAVRNCYAGFKAMYDVYFPAFSISCSSSGNCGMHVNISNACFGNAESSQALAIKKLLYIVNRHFKLVCALTNRDPNRTMYCARMNEFVSMTHCKNADLNHMPSSHGICFNAGHYPEGRIELRIVGGQSTFGCFRNTMECVFHLVDAVKRLKWEDLDDVTKIFAGCNRYVFDRLNTKCRQAGVITSDDVNAIRETINRGEVFI